MTGTDGPEMCAAVGVAVSVSMRRKLRRRVHLLIGAATDLATRVEVLRRADGRPPRGGAGRARGSTPVAMTTVSAGPTLQGMADADAQAASRGPATRWLRPLGAGSAVVIVVLSARTHPLPALHGSGLVVTIALVTIAICAFAMLMHGEPGPFAIAPVLVVAASGALVWVQHGGPGVAGLFLAVSYGAQRVSLARSVAIAGLGIVALAVGIGHENRSAGVIVSAELGLVAFYMISIFARRVQEAHDEMARLLAELQESRQAQEDAAALRERGRIAREIHDVLAHSLSGLVLQLEGARMLAGQPNANGDLAAALDRAHHLARAGLDEARRAVGALRDDDLPGPDRLEQLLADFRRDSGVAAQLHVTGEPRPLDPESSLTLFRVAQEALTNSRRHSHAESVEVALCYEPDAVSLLIEDHGAAVPAALGSDRGDGGYGLTGMRERAALIGGTLRAAPTGDGFRVELRIPR